MPRRDWFSEPSSIIFLGGPRACSVFFITLSCLLPARSDGNVYITDSIFLQEPKHVRAEETVMFCFQNMLRWLF